MRRVRGFTLIELVVAVSIVAILAAIAYPGYQTMVRKGRRGDAMAALSLIQQAQEKWRANNTTYGTTANVWTSDRCVSGPRAALSNTEECWYSVAVTSNTATAFTATATPISDQASDTCALFSITQDGPVLTTDADRDCWRK